MQLLTVTIQGQLKSGLCDWGTGIIELNCGAEICTCWNGAKLRLPIPRECGQGEEWHLGEKKNWTALGSDLKTCHLFTQSFKCTNTQHLGSTGGYQVLSCVQRKHARLRYISADAA